MFIFITAIVGFYYAKYEGLNALKAGLSQLSKNEVPAYEMISGAAIAFAAVLLIVPGFFTDLVGFLLLLPFTRKIIFRLVFKSKTNVRVNNNKENKTIDGEIINKDKKDEL